MEADELLKRSRSTIERNIGNYFIFEIDKNPVACVALEVYPESGQGELASLYVSAVAREPGHRPEADSVRREPGACSSA